MNDYSSSVQNKAMSNNQNHNEKAVIPINL